VWFEGSVTMIIILLVLSFIYHSPQAALKVETRFDEQKNLSTQSLGPVRLSGPKNRYHSLDFSLSRSYEGTASTAPDRINFELVSVVKARLLNSDLYVVFVVDGKQVHFSSNRSAIRNPVPGRLWIGERMIFSIPIEDFLKITNAEKLSLKMGADVFDFNDTSREALRVFLAAVRP
jgi:hypothetical protein